MTQPPETARRVRGIVLLTRKPGMSQSEFDSYWLEVHSIFARKLPNIIRYAQLHLAERIAVGDIPPDADVRVDGIVDFVYTSPEDIPAIWESPEGQESLADALKVFATITEFYVDETVFIDHLGIGALTEASLASEPTRYP
jgi:uncharacterized protein (TIGR02118 family)